MASGTISAPMTRPAPPAEDELAELARDVLLRHRAGRERLHQVARLVQNAVERVGVNFPRPRDELHVELRLLRRAGADAVDMRSGADECAVKER